MENRQLNCRIQFDEAEGNILVPSLRNIPLAQISCLYAMAPTMTWLGCHGDERRQPRLGAKASQRYKFSSGEGGGVILPASCTEIAAPQDAKLSAMAPEPSEQLRIMTPTPRRHTRR